MPPTTRLEIERMLVVSTAHVSQRTAEMLPRGHADMVEHEEDGDIWMPSFARESGWLFYVGPKDEMDGYGETPKDLRDVLEFARLHDCVWVMFDNDGPIVDGLYEYDW